MISLWSCAFTRVNDLDAGDALCGDLSPLIFPCQEEKWLSGTNERRIVEWNVALGIIQRAVVERFVKKERRAVDLLSDALHKRPERARLRHDWLKHIVHEEERAERESDERHEQLSPPLAARAV